MRILYQRKGRHTLCAGERSHSLPERGGIFCVRGEEEGGGGGLRERLTD